jgi:hypothetical protein
VGEKNRRMYYLRCIPHGLTSREMFPLVSAVSARRSTFTGTRREKSTRMSPVLVRAARACSVCHVVFFSLNRRKNRYGYLKRALEGAVEIDATTSKSTLWACEI